MLAFPLNQDAKGHREVIRGHSFRAREGVQYDVNAVWPLLSGVKPNDPNVAPPFVDPREVLEGEPQVEEGVLDDMPAVPAPSRRESVPAEVEEVPAAGNLEEDETMDVDLRGDEDDDDMELGMIERLDHCIHWYHQDAWNEFASQETCIEVGSKGTVFSEMFGGIKIEVEVPLEVNDELTGLPLNHEQVVEGMKTEVKQLETLKVGRNMTESEARKISREKGAKILTSRWVLTQKTPSLARCRLVVRDFASGAESAFRSGIYAPTSSLDSLRCVLALASLWDLWLITSDVSTAFMYAEVEEDACDLVLLPSNISYKGERVVCLLFKAMNGLRRAPLLWFYQLQRTVYSLGGEDTFESTFFRLSTKRGLVLILVYVDDLLIAAQDQEEGEAFLSKLQAIWKMKVTGRIPCPLDPLGMPQQTIGEIGLRMFNDAKAAISMGKMDGLLRRVRHLELRVKYCQHLHKTRKLSITHWKGEENPSDGLTKSLRPLSLWTNLVEAVGLVPGPTDQGSNWIRNYLNLIQQESDLDTFLALPFVASKKGISR